MNPTFYMNQHPNESQWMEYVYDELLPANKRAFEDHISACEECARKKAGYLATVQALNRWEVTVPAGHRMPRRWAPALKWAAAVALVATTAFSAGRMSTPLADMSAIHASLAPVIQQSVERQVAAKVASEIEAVREEAAKAQGDLAAQMQALSDKTLAESLAANKQQLEKLARTVAVLREEDRKLVFASLKEIESQLVLENRKLREGIETVALVTDRGLRDAQRKLVQLAAFTNDPTQAP